MKILFIDFEYPPIGGGGGVANKVLIDELAKKHTVDIITTKFKDTPFYEKDNKVRIYRVPVLFRRFRATSTLASLVSYCITAYIKGIILIRENEYDIVHSFFAVPSGLVGLFLSWHASIPHVLTIIGGDIHDPTKKLSPSKNFMTRFTVKKVMQKSDYITAISSDVAKRARKLYQLKSRVKIDVVSLGFKKPTFNTKSKASSRRRGDFFLVTLARLIERKGLDYLIKAVGLLQDKKIRLVVIGDGPERNNLTELVKRLQLEDRVIFAGYLKETEKYKLLSNADCFILPSLHEGFGLVYLEAMYCGLPVIASNVGGQTDFLEDGKNGFIVPVKDVKAITEAINKISSNRSLTRRISRYNKKEVRQYYITRIVKKYEEVYKKLSTKL